VNFFEILVWEEAVLYLERSMLDKDRKKPRRELTYINNLESKKGRVMVNEMNGKAAVGWHYLLVQDDWPFLPSRQIIVPRK